jgi:hypothetical protein
MPAARRPTHADLFRRLDELPISEDDRRTAKAQAALAFGIVDAICDAFDHVMRALFASPARAARR